MLVFMFVLVFMAATGMGSAIVAAQIVAHRTTGRATEACTNG